MITPNNVVSVSGTVSIEEEKEPKILVNAVVKPTVDTAVGAEQKQKRNGLFLRFKSKNDDRIAEVKTVLAWYKGDFPMYYYLEDEQKYIKAQPQNFVRYDDGLVRVLKGILGEENVAVKF